MLETEFISSSEDEILGAPTSESDDLEALYAERDAEVHKVHELVMLRHCCLLLCGARAQLLAFTCLVHKVHERSARKCLGCIYNRIDT